MKEQHLYIPSGFSLLELMISTGVLAILVMISVPVLRSYVQRNDLEVISNVVVQDLYRAQNLARNGENGGSWGVYIQSGSITVFQGNTYASRVQSKDEIFNVSSAISISGQNEYDFSIFTGLPTTAGSTNIQKDSVTKVISISSKGVIDY